MPTRWSIKEGVSIKILSWPDEDDYLCCNEATSDIFLISIFGNLILSYLSGGKLSEAELYKRISRALGSELTDQLTHSIDHHLFSFKAIDLIQSSE